MNGHVEVVREILSHGVNQDLKDKMESVADIPAFLAEQIAKFVEGKV